MWLKKLLFGEPKEQAGCGTASDITSPYSGARITKLNNHWMPQHYSGDNAIRESWSLLTARIRDRVRNDGVLTKCKATLSSLVVGSGMLTFSEASELSEEDEQLLQFELESDTWFDRWALEEADAEREHSYWDMQLLAFEDMIEAGNAIWLKVLDNDPKRIVPLCYQLIEWEQIDMTVDRDAEMSRNHKGRHWNRISNGIEFDRSGRKVAFHLYDAHPYDNTTGWQATSRAIPAERILHQYIPHRPSSKLGVTWFAPQLQTNHDLDRYVANELTTRALTALMGVAIKTNDTNASVGLDAEDTDTGLPAFKLGYPFIGTLKKDDEVEVVETKRDTKEAAALINLLLNLQSMGCRVSLHRLLGDASKANLATIKATNQDDEDLVEPIKGSMARRVVRPIRKEFTSQAVAYGRIRSITPAEYQRKPYQYNAVTVIAGKRADLDVDDGIAAIDRMRSGLSTYQDECARRGRHWRRNLRQMARINGETKRLDVVLDFSKGQGAAPTVTSTDADKPVETPGAANAPSQ